MNRKSAPHIKDAIEFNLTLKAYQHFRAASLAMYGLFGDADLINKELDCYQAVTAEEIKTESNIIFDEKNSNTLYYYSDN